MDSGDCSLSPCEAPLTGSGDGSLSPCAAPYAVSTRLCPSWSLPFKDTHSSCNVASKHNMTNSVWLKLKTHGQVPPLLEKLAVWGQDPAAQVQSGPK